MPLFESELFSPKYWINYLLNELQSNPEHVIIELACIGLIIYLLFKREGGPKVDDDLTEAEENDIIAAWKPEPLVKPSEDSSDEKMAIVESIASRSVKIAGRDVLNFSSHNYLGLVERKEIQQVAREAIDKYGVGSCGPRGFYGSFDVHIELEKKVAEFYGVNDAILYSDGMACISSVIPAFAKPGDIIVCDKGVHFGIQQGIMLSRTNKVFWFRHNDMAHLEEVLKEATKKDGGENAVNLKNRRFIITEGLFQNYGDICQLDQVVKLKNRFKFRLILDDSYGVGVLGATGRGTHEKFNLKIIDDVEVVVGVLDTSLASCGGFCAAEHAVIDHQRLSGAGYVFSASGPPFSSVAGTKALSLVMAEAKTLLPKLRTNVDYIQKKLRALDGIVVKSSPESPLIYLSLTSAHEDHKKAVKSIASMVINLINFFEKIFILSFYYFYFIFI
jgi:serine palmitoyltransferase